MMLLKMFISMLHERKIILIHTNSGDNATLIETLVSLMNPLKWNFVCISQLIPSMLDYLDAPFPYIVGVTREVWTTIQETKWDGLCEEIVAFDIDYGRIFKKEKLPDFPEPFTQFLITSLEKQLQKLKQNNIEEDFWN